jgi:hypothetical protein
MEDERRGEIGLTPDDVLAANMAALGIQGQGKTNPRHEIILGAFVSFIAEHHRAPNAVDICSRTGINPTTVRAACRALCLDGRMLLYRSKATGQNAYIPKVI